MEKRDLKNRIIERIVEMWFYSLSDLDKIRIKDEETFREYVNIYLTILDIRDSSSSFDTDIMKTIRKLSNNKIIRMHGKINSFTQTKYKHLRKEIFGD